MKADRSPLRTVLDALGIAPTMADQYSARCPAHDDDTASLSVGVRQDGTVGLYCHAGCDAAAVCSALGITTADLFPNGKAKRPATKARQRKTAPKASPRESSRSVAPIPEEEWTEARNAAKKFGPSAFTGFKLTGLYPYRLANGSVRGWRARYEDGKGKKEIKPLHFNGSEWVNKEHAAPRRAGKPLYRLPETLASEGTVWIVEGEKCADALADLGLPATTSGSATSAGRADWSQLAGRSCIVWPDNDEPGDKYAAEVAARLAGLGCAVAVVDVDGLDLPGEGYDAADWLQDHPKATADDIRGLPTTAPAGSEPVVSLVRASDIKPKPINWLWYGWLARSMLHILAGDGGTGKTTLALSLAAAVSNGGHLPDGIRAKQGNVLFWTGEDALSEVLVPRLQQAGADMARIFFVGSVGEGRERRAFDPATDVYALEQQARRIGDVSLVVVDPIASAVAGDSHKNTEVRRGLQPLVDLGEALGAAVLGITHFSKNSTSRKATERIIGSVAFGALARVAMVTAMGKDGKCRIVRSKSNIGPQGGGFEYEVQVVEQELDGVATEVSKVVWGNQLSGWADDLLSQVESKRLQREEAGDWLYQLLKEGPMPSKELKAKAAEDGVAWRTIERAKEQLEVIAERQGVKGKGRGVGDWIWRLPVSGREVAQDRQRG